MTSQGAGNQEPASRMKGRVALITGAHKRIGRAIALALAEEGVSIAAHSRAPLRVEEETVCREITANEVKCWNIAADLEKPDEYYTLIARTIELCGRLDFLVNSASIFLSGTLKTIGLSDVVRHAHVNAWAPFVLSRDFARLAGRGAIVNLLDTNITGFDDDHAAYILSKKMLAELTRICALEFAPHVTVNAVAPGLILPPAGKDEGYLAERARTVPLKQHGSAEDIADAVVYLLGSDFVTGQTIFVDGGMHLREGQGGQDPY
ncbi:MAG TPA: SDR family oxidoreductase [Nitrospirota bacterium]|nr:SDR family oxidoreductase [Nitrospirota bacterium]